MQKIVDLEVAPELQLDLTQFSSAPFRNPTLERFPVTHAMRAFIKLCTTESKKGCGSQSLASISLPTAESGASTYGFHWYHDTPYAWLLTLSPHFPLGELDKECVRDLNCVEDSPRKRFMAELIASKPQGLVGFVPMSNHYTMITQIQGLNLSKSYQDDQSSAGDNVTVERPAMTHFFSLHPLLLSCALRAAYAQGFKGVVVKNGEKNPWIYNNGPLTIERAVQLYNGSATLARGPQGERFLPLKTRVPHGWSEGLGVCGDDMVLTFAK